MLDEQMRRRVRGLADVEDGAELDAAARERVVAVVRTRGADEVRRAVRARRARGAALGLVAAAAAIAIAWVAWPRPSIDMPQVASMPGCTQWAAPPSARFAGGNLDLGRRALLVSSADAIATVERNEACALAVRLERGRVRVHARDLGGGELRVRTDLADVVVHGTRFVVDRNVRGLDVSVTEGVVAIEVGGEEIARLGAGERHHLPAPMTATAVAPSTVPGGPDVTAPAPAGAPPRDASPDRARPTVRAEEPAGPSTHGEWLALAQGELRAGRFAEARDALAEARRRGADSDPLLAPTLASAELRLERAAGNRARATEIAEEIVRRWPRSSEADRARRILNEEENRR